MAHEIQQLQFPFAVTDRRRLMPTEFIGASLFSALNRSAKPVVVTKMTELSRMNGYQLSYKGRVLTQAHADVWLAIIEIFKRHERTRAGMGVEFRASQILRLIGKTANMKARLAVYETITDMMACAVRIVQPGQVRAWTGPIVMGEIDKNDLTGETSYRVILHPVLCEAYKRGFTSCEWLERKAIGKNELALWLHQYLLAFPQPLPIGELQLHCWQSTASRAAFRHRLRHAATVLHELGLISRWGVDREDRLVVQRADVHGRRP